jgi:DNA-directed RNA polymerase specialized sigma24 family protein
VHDAHDERAPPTVAFEDFVVAVEPGLRRALSASYGPEIGRDAAVDALVWAWRHWGRVLALDNAGGYLFRVGESSARRHLRRQRLWRSARGFGAAVHWDNPQIEPGVVEALARLSPRQRAAVLLVHGHGHTLSEAATLMGCSISTVRNHVDRALTHLRTAIGEPDA